MGSYTIHRKTNLSLSASLLVYRKSEVVVSSHRDDFENDMVDGKVGNVDTKV